MQTISSLLKSMQAPPREVKLFQLLCWPNTQHVPNSTQALVQLVDEVTAWRSRCGHEDKRPLGSSDAGDRVLIVSDDGYSRCGIFCAAASSLEQVHHRGEADIFQAVKTVRMTRPQMVANPMEYKYCYDVVLHYVLSYCGDSGGQTRAN